MGIGQRQAGRQSGSRKGWYRVTAAATFVFEWYTNELFRRAAVTAAKKPMRFIERRDGRHGVMTAAEKEHVHLRVATAMEA